MPPGYKCDRCGEFEEAYPGPNTFGNVENVLLDDPNSGSEGGDGTKYTLCSECRVRLTEWVELHD